jgi:EAL domain-containing protein (putative c-di-GMP-specific phosphodiesterase class I)
LVLNQIKALGVRIYLDDFGTGYSSLNYLRQLSADLVKIDHSLINQLPEEIHSSLCRAILQMARDLGFKVIAEGVETEAQRQILLELGCEFGQGFLFSQPLDAANIERVLRDSLRMETTPPGA